MGSHNFTFVEWLVLVQSIELSPCKTIMALITLLNKRSFKICTRSSHFTNVKIWGQIINFTQETCSHVEQHTCSHSDVRLSYAASGGRAGPLISHNILIKRFQKVNSPTKSSTSGLQLQIKTISRIFCGGVDFLKQLDQSTV